MIDYKKYLTLEERIKFRKELKEEEEKQKKNAEQRTNKQDGNIL